MVGIDDVVDKESILWADVKSRVSRKSRRSRADFSSPRSKMTRGDTTLLTDVQEEISISKMPSYYHEVENGELDVAEGIKRAKDDYELLLLELAEKEEVHELSLRTWSKLQLEFTKELTPYVIGRALKYYEAMMYQKKCSERVQELTQQFGEKTKEFENAMKGLRDGENAFELAKTQEERQRLIWEVSNLSDLVAKSQKERDEADGRCSTATHALQESQQQWDRCRAEHDYCTYNCSVIKSKDYYMTYARHIDIIEVQQRQIEAVEKRITLAKHVYRELQRTLSKQKLDQEQESSVKDTFVEALTPDEALQPARPVYLDNRFEIDTAMEVARMEKANIESDGFYSCDEEEE